MNKILECSSKGDRRFSALFAKIKMFGVLDSIENHYQNTKRNNFGDKVKKGAYVDHIILNGVKLESRFLTQWYNLLWVEYLDNNPELVEILKKYDDYSDIFKGKAINCQADTIRMYMGDKTKLIESYQELIAILKNQRKEIYK